MTFDLVVGANRGDARNTCARLGIPRFRALTVRTLGRSLRGYATQAVVHVTPKARKALDAGTYPVAVEALRVAVAVGARIVEEET